jgi:putative oxidoreductase
MDLALLVLRLVVGLFFAGHGAQKLWGAFGGHGIEGTGQFFDSLGMRPGRRNAYAAGWSEFLGGVLLAFGLFTPLAAVLIISVMTTAILTIHAKNGPWASDSGYEYNAVLIASAFVLAANPGDWSLDAAFGLGAIHGTAFAIAALVIGVLGGFLAVAAGRSGRLAGAPPTPTAEPQDARFDRTPSEERAATIAAEDRPGIPPDPR